MEIIAVVDQPLVPENRDQLVDRQVFCVDEEGWHETPGMLRAFMNASTSLHDLNFPVGMQRMLRTMAGGVTQSEAEAGRLINSALSSPEAVNLHFLIDGDGRDRDMLPYYLAAGGYVQQHGGRAYAYAKNAEGALASLAVAANERHMLATGRLTFGYPISRPRLARCTQSVAERDYANRLYWEWLRDFLMQNAVEGMRDEVAAKLRQVERDPTNVSRELVFDPDFAWDAGLIEEPTSSVDGLCRRFEVRAGECVEHLPQDHAVSRFFDVEGRDERYAQLVDLSQGQEGRGEEAPVLEGLSGDGNGDRGPVRGSHLRVIK